MPRLTTHDLRHTAISRWIASGLDAVEVARQAGDTVETVTKTYMHEFDRAKRRDEIRAKLAAGTAFGSRLRRRNVMTELTWADQIERGRAEAGIYICVSCRDNPGDHCNDYCEMEQLRELPPLGLTEGYPPCECCGELMHLLRPLIAIPTYY